MPDLGDLLQHGAGNPWLFVPTAMLLGALHGLEPGHSKTMMAAFIIAVRGTVTQAVQLGLSAALSHTFVVWAVALAGLTWGARFQAEASEAYFQVASAAIIVAIALWMLRRSWLDLQDHDHHEHDHDHHQEHDDHDHHEHCTPLPNPAGAQSFDTRPLDPHALAHAREIEKTFRGGTVTTRQIVLFGLTGGLIPCPAAVTVLLVCLQLKHLSLGVTLVAAFSVGLAATMIAAGVVAALGLKHATARWPAVSEALHYAPLVSATLVLLLGLYMGHLGWSQLA